MKYRLNEEDENREPDGASAMISSSQSPQGAETENIVSI